MVVAFATVVVDANGARALLLRRGCETLVAMPLGRTNVEHCGSIVGCHSLEAALHQCSCTSRMRSGVTLFLRSLPDLPRATCTL